MIEPYHPYVFEHGRFVGRFEEMYQAEDREGFDSWHQENLSLKYDIALLLVRQRLFPRILDIGCGKGAFTAKLHRNNIVKGIDLSETAMKKARLRYPGIAFKVATAEAALTEQWDLIVMAEMLSYVEDWPALLEKAARHTEYLLVMLHIPDDPIGYVKSVEDLRHELDRSFAIETEIEINPKVHLLMAKRRA